MEVDSLLFCDNENQRPRGGEKGKRGTVRAGEGAFPELPWERRGGDAQPRPRPGQAEQPEEGRGRCLKNI